MDTLLKVAGDGGYDFTPFLSGYEILENQPIEKKRKPQSSGYDNRTLADNKMTTIAIRFRSGLDPSYIMDILTALDVGKSASFEYWSYRHGRSRQALFEVAENPVSIISAPNDFFNDEWEVDFKQAGVSSDTVSTTVSAYGTVVNSTDGTWNNPNNVKAAALSGSPSANASTDIITLSGHGLTNTSVVELSSGNGALPGGLTEGVNYYVINVTSTTFQLAATLNGAAINITTNGTAGWQILAYTDTPGALNTDWDLVVSGFGLNIPSDAVINSVTIEASYKCSTANSVSQVSLGCRCKGTPRGTALPSTLQPLVNTPINTDKCGTWKVSELNSADCQVYLRVRRKNSIACTYYIDYVKITVNYYEKG